MSAQDPIALLVGAGVGVGVDGEAWLVGGALRDRLLGRASTDYDVALTGDPEPAARALARDADGYAFLLSEGFGAWRVLARTRAWQVDLVPLSADTIELDLARRDLTINAIAQPLRGGELIDPLGGLTDLRGGRLRMASRAAFADDPLRTIRLARLACELGFHVEAETAVAAARNAPRLGGVAPERVFAELSRIVSAHQAVAGLELMDTLGVTKQVLPELDGLRGIEQSRYHHLDVHEHTMAVLAQTIELERDPHAVLGVQGEAVRGLLAQPLANELTRGQALRFGALFHDAAKPQTRGVSAEGKVTFIGHDEAGAQMARIALARLRASERLSEHVAALARHHLRLGFLVHQTPLSRRAIYRYLRACEPVGVDVTLLSVADRLATLGSGAGEAIAKHLELAGEMLGEAFAWRSARPRPPVRGDRLARELGIPRGPGIGRVLAELEEASFAGEIHTPEQAIELARVLIHGAGR
ncbi:MAG: HDIG domain-containing metalloprotein [Solirubrobacteraceae bacterium]